MLGYITSTNKQLENMSIDPKFVELTPDVLKIFFMKCWSDSVSIWNRGFVSHRDFWGGSRLLFSNSVLILTYQITNNTLYSYPSRY